VSGRRGALIGVLGFVLMALLLCGDCSALHKKTNARKATSIYEPYRPLYQHNRELQMEALNSVYRIQGKELQGLALEMALEPIFEVMVRALNKMAAFHANAVEGAPLPIEEAGTVWETSAVVADATMMANRAHVEQFISSNATRMSVLEGAVIFCKASQFHDLKDSHNVDQMIAHLELSTERGRGQVWDDAPGAGTKDTKLETNGPVAEGAVEGEDGEVEGAESMDDSELFTVQELAMIREMGEEFHRFSLTKLAPQSQKSRLDRSNRSNRKRTSKRRDEL